MIHADFETRSEVDLIKAGAYIYAAHPSTDVNCLGWAIGDEEVELWVPGDPLPKKLLKHLMMGDRVAAWNAQFERLIWNNVLVRYGFPPLPIERFYCIAALSRCRGFPGKLEKAARFCGLNYQKDMDGHYLMLKLCKPRSYTPEGEPVWWDHQPDYERLGDYCKQDVVVERAMGDILIPFTDEELSDFHLSEEINDRGLLVDIELAEAAVTGVEKEKIDANDVLVSLTDGAVTSYNQVAKIMAWVEQEWKPLPNLNKSTLYDEMLEDDIPPHVYDVLEIRLENARAAVSKFAAMLNRNQDGVVRGLFMFHGAGPGRFTSTGLQIHNAQSDCATHAIPVLKQRGVAGLRMLGDPIKLLAQMVRPAIIASPGNTLLIGDFAQIEARITAWLAGEHQLLTLFSSGISPYCSFGSLIYDRPIDKFSDPEEYKVSKACILGLGFGGAEGALARSMKKDNIVLPGKVLTDCVQTYRGTYKNIVNFWYRLRDAVLLAMYSRGTAIEIGPVTYLFDGEHLWCRLPSGRLICYPYAEIVEDDWGGDCVQYRRGNRSPKSGVMEWPTVRLWHGLLIENLAQGIAFDLLMGAMRRLREWNVRLHVHDEIVSEAPKELADQLLPKFLELMAQGEEWSVGLPIKAEGQIADRYTK